MAQRIRVAFALFCFVLGSLPFSAQSSEKDKPKVSHVVREAPDGCSVYHENWTWTDGEGVTHSFPAEVRTVEPRCESQTALPTAEGVATDSSGYRLSVVNYTQAEVYASNGAKAFSGVTATGQ